jgi:N-methylhydantoinase B
MFELHDPHVLLKHEYLPDSAGAGRWRGGVGVETEFEIRGENVTGIAFGDGVEPEARAFGLFGGRPGAANEIRLRYPDGRERVPRTKEIVRGIPRGTRYRQLAGGGGGYGDPFRRPVEDVLADVKNELVSVAAARRDYGVWVNPRTLALDAKRTARLRATRR